MFCHEPFEMFCGLQNFPQLFLWVNLSIKGTVMTIQAISQTLRQGQWTTHWALSLT